MCANLQGALFDVVIAWDGGVRGYHNNSNLKQSEQWLPQWGQTLDAWHLQNVINIMRKRDNSWEVPSKPMKSA